MNAPSPIRGSGRELRRAERAGTFLAAILRRDGHDRTVMVRNVSDGGAMIEADELPPIGTAVELIRAELSVLATVNWVSGRRAGLTFDAPIKAERWAPGLRHRQQMAVDSKIAEARAAIRDAAKIAPPIVAAGEPDAIDLTRRVAEELGVASRRIEHALDTLSRSAPVAVRHTRELQELEIVATLLARFERVLGEEDKRAAIEAIGIPDVRRRLLR